MITIKRICKCVLLTLLSLNAFCSERLPWGYYHYSSIHTSSQFLYDSLVTIYNNTKDNDIKNKVICFMVDSVVAKDRYIGYPWHPIFGEEKDCSFLLTSTKEKIIESAEKHPNSGILDYICETKDIFFRDKMKELYKKYADKDFWTYRRPMVKYFINIEDSEMLIDYQSTIRTLINAHYHELWNDIELICESQNDKLILFLVKMALEHRNFYVERYSEIDGGYTTYYTLPTAIWELLQISSKNVYEIPWGKWHIVTKNHANYFEVEQDKFEGLMGWFQSYIKDSANQ